MGNTEVLYGSRSPGAGKQKLQKRRKVPQGILKTNYVRTRGSPSPLASCRLRRWAHDHLSHPRARPRPLPTRPNPCTPDLELKVGGCPGPGAAAQGYPGVMKPSCSSPLPPEESHLGPGGRVSAPALKLPGAHVLRHVSRNAGELSLSGQGIIREEKDSKSVRERSGRSQNIPARPALISPLTQSPGLPAPGSGSRSRLGTGAGVLWRQTASTTSDFRTESARSSDPSRRGWPGAESERRGQGQAKGGARGQPEGIKRGQEGAKTPPATIELLPPPSWV